MTRWSEGFVAVDWGTTNRRAYAIDAAGQVVDSDKADAGVLAIAPGGFPAEVAKLRARFGGLPLLMAGMVGSNRGWIETPYVACPATLADLAAKLCHAEPGWAAIVPGLSILDGDRADVMRGEEVQIFGAIALGAVAERTTICHPGTHTKWIAVERARITDFRTIMTGELFALIRAHSILAPLLAGEAVPGAAFRAGVERGFATGALGAELFSIRARALLGRSEAADAPSFASGLLIGCDLRSGVPDGQDEAVVVGSPTLTRLYAEALRHIGRRPREIDGAAAFVAGMRAIAETIG
ncbi:MAG: 2-dehydro-3-deoxygalactonokinase [Sphingomonas bacterium]|nr:2-dehydro-3-deoxygalactonokinase [Sphingomonas bacterium]